MKRKILAPALALGLVAVAAVAVFVSFGSRADAANVLANPDFATDIAGWTAPSQTAAERHDVSR